MPSWYSNSRYLKLLRDIASVRCGSFSTLLSAVEAADCEQGFVRGQGGEGGWEGGERETGGGGEGASSVRCGAGATRALLEKARGARPRRCSENGTPRTSVSM